MDNCGGHELDVMPDSVRIEFLPPQSTMKHQPLDLGLISSAKIRYCSNLLNCLLDVLRMRRATNQTLRTSKEKGKWGLQDGQLPHVGDAIQIFKNAWSCMPRTSVMKCWIRSECLGSGQAGQLQSLLDAIQTDNDVDIDLTSPNGSSRSSGEMVITEVAARSVSQAISEFRFMDNEPTTPLHEILDQVKDINEESELLAILNSPAPLDNGSTRTENSVQGLIEIHNNSLAEENLSANNHQENDGNNEHDSQILTSLTQITGEAMKVTSDPALLEALRMVEQRISVIQEVNLSQ